VIRFIKASSASGPGSVETVVENLTDMPIEIGSITSALPAECGDPCPPQCPECNLETINGKKVITFGKGPRTQTVQPRTKSQPSSYPLVPR
jgi:hypothetical protein